MYMERCVMSETEIQGTHKEFSRQERRQLHQIMQFFRIKKIFRGYEETQATERFAEISVQVLKCLVLSTRSNACLKMTLDNCFQMSLFMSLINEMSNGILCFMTNNKISVERLSPDFSIDLPDSFTFEQKNTQGGII